MKKYFLYPLMALLAGCSTGPYLYPESTTGKNAVLDRTCPGPKAAMSFAPSRKNSIGCMYWSM